MRAGDSEAKLILGDCLAVLPTLAPGSVDLFLADPPYGIDYQSHSRTDREEWLPKVANDGLPFVWWLWPAARAMADGGGLLCFCRWDVSEAFRLAIGWAGLEVRGQLVWDRLAHGAGDTAGSPAPRHDLLWYATKGRRVFHGRRPVSVVRAMRLSGDALAHPNEKPVPLLAQLVDLYAAPGALVADPFAGTANAGVACLQTGRHYLGVEIDHRYHALGARRLAQARAARLLKPRREF